MPPKPPIATIRLLQLELHPLHLPLRGRFRHAAHERSASDNLLLCLRARSSNGSTLEGWGESIPRAYVTAETVQTVQRAVESVFQPLLHQHNELDPTGLINLADALPCTDPTNRASLVHAARCAVEMALLELASLCSGRSVAHLLVARSPADPQSGPEGPRTFLCERVSGVLSAGAPQRVARRIARMWMLGLSDFKLKLGLDDATDRAVVDAAVRALGPAMAAGTASLRADANGAWTPDQAGRWAERLASAGFAALEQPLAQTRPLAADQLTAVWAELTRGARLPILPDESLLHERELAGPDGAIARRAISGVNIRIARQGGLLSSLRIIRAAQKAGLMVQVGCLVGETSLLASAQRSLLAAVRPVRFVEGSYGPLLLARDVCRWPRLFAPWARLPAIRCPGWGIRVDRRRLARIASAPPVILPLSDAGGRA